MDYFKYIDAFVDEADGNVRAIGRNLNEFRLESRDERTVLNELFRSAHNLKASAATMGFTVFARLTNDLENVVRAIQDGRIRRNERLFELLFSCMRGFECILLNITEFGGEGDNTYTELGHELSDYVESCGSGAENIGAVTGENMEGDGNAKNGAAYGGDAKSGAADNGAEAGAGVGAGAGAGVGVGGAFGEGPDFEGMDAFSFGGQDGAGDYLYDSDAGFGISFPAETVTEEEIEEAATGGYSDKKTGFDSDEGSVRQVRIDSNLLDALTVLVNELGSRNAGLMRAIKEKEDACGGGAPDSSDAHDGNACVVGGSGDIVDSGDIKVMFSEVYSVSERISEALMRLRTNSIASAFERYVGIVRGIALRNGKQAELVILGGDTRCDRTLLQELNEPLLHIFRNAIDHGIETPKTRLECGKPASGCIFVRAWSDGAELSIEIEDDGKGISIAKLKAAAIKKGILTREEAAAASEEDILKIVFMPSISTLDKPTELSGRGVGLDAVRDVVEEIGGHVGISSREGFGTRILILLPESGYKYEVVKGRKPHEREV